MDPTLHQKMGVNHLNRVLGYAPFVAKEGRAEVHLTSEDWWVVADTLFNMNTPREILPVAIQEFRLLDDSRRSKLRRRIA
jgi:hypothetical protein